jgi:hypothetical protein
MKIKLILLLVVFIMINVSCVTIVRGKIRPYNGWHQAWQINVPIKNMVHPHWDYVYTFKDFWDYMVTHKYVVVMFSAERCDPCKEAQGVWRRRLVADHINFLVFEMREGDWQTNFSIEHARLAQRFHPANQWVVDNTAYPIMAFVVGMKPGQRYWQSVKQQFGGRQQCIQNAWDWLNEQSILETSVWVRP